MKKTYVFAIILLDKYILSTYHMLDTELDTGDLMVNKIGTISSLIQINRQKIFVVYSKCYERNVYMCKQEPNRGYQV